jgi:hypothetical protein
MISVMANTLRIITAGSEPTRDSGSATLSHPRCTAHATAAGGVSDRNPAKSPIRNAKNSVIFYCRGDMFPNVLKNLSIFNISRRHVKRANISATRPAQDIS